MTPRLVNADPMEGRIARFAHLRQSGTPVMFIDSIIPGHYRMNYSVIGDTASENPDFKPMLTVPHRFQIGMFEAPPGNGPAWHTHEYVELFIPLTGRWRFCYGTNADDPEDLAGEALLEPWDAISFPPTLWRRFENVAQSNSWGLAVLDPHDVFTGRDPIWPAWLEELAAERGLHSDEHGRMVKPGNFTEQRAALVPRQTEELRRALPRTGDQRGLRGQGHRNQPIRRSIPRRRRCLESTARASASWRASGPTRHRPTSGSGGTADGASWPKSERNAPSVAATAERTDFMQTETWRGGAR